VCPSGKPATTATPDAQAHVALVAALAEATEHSRQKSELVATASHEIRTLLNGVMGLATLLLATDLDVTQRRYSEGILDSASGLMMKANPSPASPLWSR
jgi:signal transduction histidine kinase